MTNKIVTAKFLSSEENKFKDFLRKYNSYEVKDLYENLFVEYKMLKDPQYYFGIETDKKILMTRVKRNIADKKNFSLGQWIVYPRPKKIYHLLKKSDYLDFRTIRNRDLITWQEQKTLYNKRVVFIGMSVGSQVLLTFLRTGIGNKYVIADADKVELHNLNRTTFFLDNIGEKKVDVVSNQVFSIDPFVEVQVIREYVTEKNIKKIIDKADLIVDSFDNFKVKLMLRNLARELGIPIVSGFDISRGAMVITERYDIDKNLKLDFYLNGYSEKDILDSKDLGVEDKTNLFINIIGRKYHNKRMLNSVLRVGTELTGYPQLAVATNLASSLWTCAAIDILLGRTKESIRVYLDIEKKICGKLK